ncbi:MAG TPA: PilZ domain-containing protein [Steroidobacteraceae bacterium]|nr:PilZ domain-containing protein [Steroidobacteraceae bacterium]
MPESFLGDGLIFEELLPLAWTPGPLIEGIALARMNADNHQLLGAEASLDDVRVHEALKDESPALVHELQRLEYKLNILLRLAADLAVRNSTLPPPQRFRVSSFGLEWFGDQAPVTGTTGVVSTYINPALPQPFKVCCTVSGERTVDGQRVAQLRFSGLSDAVVDLLEKLIFRHHRRLVAGSRLASNSPT